MFKNRIKGITPRTMRLCAWLLAAAAAILLLTDAVVVYAVSAIRAPSPYIQNRTNWCWATCAKMVGEQYNVRYRRTQALPKGAAKTEYMIGLREEYAGIAADGSRTVDAGQQAIVIAVFGKEVNNAGYRQDTYNAMAYVTANDALAQGLGDYRDGGVLRKAWNDVQAVLDEGMYVIGNVYNASYSVGHSLVIKGYNYRSGLYTVYDVWDGTTVLVTKDQLLQDGFNSSYGKAAVTWVYYLINPNSPPTPRRHDNVTDAPPTAAMIRQDAEGLKEYSVNPPQAGSYYIKGKAKSNYLVFTKINDGGYYATRARDDGTFSQMVMQKLRVGDKVTMYCESPLGIKTDPVTYVVR